jgi:hypothetical protein
LQIDVDSDPVPDPAFTLMRILMQIITLMRILMQLITLMRIRMPTRSGFLFDANPDPEADPSYQNDANPSGSGFTTLPPPQLHLYFGLSQLYIKCTGPASFGR